MNELRLSRNLARWILLGIGVIALIVMAILLLIAPLNKFETGSYIALGVAILSLAGFVLLDPQALMTSLTGRTSQYGVTTALMSLIFVVLVVALYILVREASFEPIDLTEAQKYKLSQQSIDLLGNLEEDIHIVGFYPEQDVTQRDEAERWLRQYERYSNGKITYEFVDPERDPLRAQQLEITGPGSLMVFTRGDQHAEAGFADENAMTGALVRVISGEARKLYVVTGHGERSIDDFAGTGLSQARTMLERVGFEIEALNLLEKGAVPEDASMLMVAGPQAQFAPVEVEALKAYLDAGGAALLMFDPATGGGQMGNGLLGLAFSSDGTRLATAGADGSVKIWNVRSGTQLQDLHGHSSDVMDVAFSPDDSQLASAGRDGTVRVWNASTGEQIKQLDGQTDGVRRLAYSPDGSLLASVGENQALNVWNAKTLEPLSYSPIGTVTPLYTVTFSSDGSMIAAGGGSTTATGTADGTIYIWESKSGSEVLNKTLHTNIVFDMVFSSDSATLYSVAWDGTEGTLDVASGEGGTETLYPNIGITGLEIKEDGTRIYSLTDGSIHIRPPEAASTDDDVVLQEHTDMIWALRLSPADDTFATAGRDGNALISRIDPPGKVRTLETEAGGDPLLTYLNTSWGIQVNDDVVIDLVTASTYGELNPIIYTFGSGSSIVQPLSESGKWVLFGAARSVGTVDPAPTDITLTPLVSSSGEQGGSWAETDLQSQTGYQFDAAEDLPGPVSMGVSAENATTQARIVVYGDADFASDQLLDEYGDGNRGLLMNTANWLTENEALIDIPVKDVGSHTMTKPLSQVGMTLALITSICLIPFIGLVAGAAVWFVRRRRR